MITRRPGLLKAAHKLHYRTQFQGLPISVENRRGSNRYWWDENANEQGKTKMIHAYGYIRGTMGTDGDHVDVFLGPEEDAEFAFVVRLMKKPEFKDFDEDKCFLGFRNQTAAKKAFMSAYDDKRFFGGIQQMTMGEFRRRIKERKGKPLSKAMWVD